MKFLDDVIPFTTDLISFGSVHFLAVEDGVVWIQDASLGFSKAQKTPAIFSMMDPWENAITLPIIRIYQTKSTIHV